MATLQSSENDGARGRARLELFVGSLSALFIEMLVIRHRGTEVLLFSYYESVSLMAAFLGQVLGFIRTNGKNDYFRWSGRAFFLLCGISICALVTNSTFLTCVDPFKFMLFGADNPQVSTAYPFWTCVRTIAIMPAIFSLTAFAFVGFGQEMGQLFEQFVLSRSGRLSARRQLFQS